MDRLKVNSHHTAVQYLDQTTSIYRNTDSIRLLAPNQFVLNWVKNHYLGQIKNIVKDLSGTKSPNIVLEIGTRSKIKSNLTVAPRKFQFTTSEPANIVFGKV